MGKAKGTVFFCNTASGCHDLRGSLSTSANSRPGFLQLSHCSTISLLPFRLPSPLSPADHHRTSQSSLSNISSCFCLSLTLASSRHPCSTVGHVKTSGGPLKKPKKKISPSGPVDFTTPWESTPFRSASSYVFFQKSSHSTKKLKIDAENEQDADPGDDDLDLSLSPSITWGFRALLRRIEGA